MRSDLLMRIATLEGVQPAALRELDEMMEKQLTGGENAQASAIGGIDTAANILNFIDGAVSEAMMEEISENDEFSSNTKNIFLCLLDFTEFSRWCCF
jgi:flagellar motor switch protein FliG